MDRIKESVLEKLRGARKELLEIPKEQLSGEAICNWIERHKAIFYQADTITHALLLVNIRAKIKGFASENDCDVCLELRTKIVDLLDHSTNAIDSKQNIKPILDDLISRVTDTKLAVLLLEFNAARIAQPNIAAAGFRTILSLIFRERAKIVDPTSPIATRDDISFDRDIKAAVNHPTLFNPAEKKLLSRHLAGGDKDSFDNVVHKSEFLINKDELEDAVGLLNRLLPTIIIK